MAYYRSTILVSMDPICVDKGAVQVKEQLIAELKAQNLLDEVQLIATPRLGEPETEGPDILINPEGSHYIALTPESVPLIVQEHFVKGRQLDHYTAKMRE